MAKIDPDGECVAVDQITGLVRVDNVPVFKVMTTNHGIYLQFYDGDKMRSEYRGSQYIEVPLDLLVETIKGACA